MTHCVPVPILAPRPGVGLQRCGLPRLWRCAGLWPHQGPGLHCLSRRPPLSPVALVASEKCPSLSLWIRVCALGLERGSWCFTGQNGAHVGDLTGATGCTDPPRSPESIPVTFAPRFLSKRGVVPVSRPPHLSE